MHAHYSVQALSNLVFWPVTDRFADRRSAVSEPQPENSGRGQHYSDSPIYQDTGCKLFPSCLDRPLSSCADSLYRTTLERELRWYRHLRPTTAAVAQGGV